MENSFFWLIYIVLIFWSLYQKWDEKKDKYIEHPTLTTIYFFGASVILSIFFPTVLRFFNFEISEIIVLLGVLAGTFLIYKILRLISKQESNWFFFDYIQLLDTRFIIPKFAEIVFQQIAFLSVFILSLETFGEAVILITTVLIFIIAHLNLFLFTGKREAVFYLLFSILGAPTFILLIIHTEALWLSISAHMVFYTLLSISAWSWGVLKRGK
jgi:hypothetical protein